MTNDHDPHALYRAKFFKNADTGQFEVVPGWNTERWIQERWAGFKKTSSRNAHNFWDRR